MIDISLLQNNASVKVEGVPVHVLRTAMNIERGSGDTARTVLTLELLMTDRDVDNIRRAVAQATVTQMEQDRNIQLSL